MSRRRLIDTHKGAVADKAPPAADKPEAEKSTPSIDAASQIDDTLRRHKTALRELSKR